jgi:hypothetical protein
MYAWKDSLAIDGKAMYFGGEKRTSDLGLRPFKYRHGSRGFTRIKVFDLVLSIAAEIRG